MSKKMLGLTSPEGVPLYVNQVWLDMDWRSEGRRLIVTGVLDNTGSGPRVQMKCGSRFTYVKLSRLKKGSTGYQPEGPSA